MDLREIVWRLFKQALKGLKRKRKKNTNIETHFIKLKLDTKAKKIKSVNGERGERERGWKVGKRGGGEKVESG